MSKTNKQIFQEFIDHVINPQNFDLVYDYLSEECIFHSPPFVGLGISIDDTSGDKVLIKEITPNSPAAEHLQEGDEVVRVSDEVGVRDTYKQINSTPWGLGKVDTPIKLTIRRDDNVFDYSFSRGRIEGFDTVLSEYLEVWIHDTQKTWPDQKSEINLIIEDGDFVAYYMMNSGTNADYNQPALWAESGIVRFEDGKITEWWSVEDDLSLFSQLGYSIIEPTLDHA
jgi:predicted SnoaL-like aldol condensation-catalyzing enzyme